MSGDIRKFAAISKTEENDDGTIQVFGIASTESVDSQGECVSKAAMENALPDYFKHGTGPLRAMHQPIAAGFVSKAEVNDAGETIIEATVVDPVEVKKVLAGVYKGFSVGGKKLPGGYDAITKTITAMRLTEISLVDRPANPEAVITMFKGDDIDAGKTVTATVTPEAVASVDALAELLNKGAIDPARLVQLAQDDIAKTAGASAPVVEGVISATAEVTPAADDAAAAPAAQAADDTAKGEGIGGAITSEGIGVADVKKGMCSVSRFAELIQSIGYLVSDAEWEADCEKDGSPVPAQLREWLASGATIFQAMAVEEINEFIEQFKTPEATSAAVVSLDVELSDNGGELAKSLNDAAAVSLVDYLTIAKTHMPENDVAQIVLKDGFEKATAAIVAKVSPASDAIAKLADATQTIAKLSGECDTLKGEVARLKALPAAGKATLRVVVEKGADIVQAAPAAKEGPILKADGSVDTEATALAAIKKVHQTGGQALSRF